MKRSNNSQNLHFFQVILWGETSSLIPFTARLSYFGVTTNPRFGCSHLPILPWNNPEKKPKPFRQKQPPDSAPQKKVAKAKHRPRTELFFFFSGPSSDPLRSKAISCRRWKERDPPPPHFLVDLGRCEIPVVLMITIQKSFPQ